MTTDLDLNLLIKSARGRLPSSHRALLEEIGVQDAVVHEWPSGVQALYETVGEAPPARQALEQAVAVWLEAVRVVAYNGPLLLHALGDSELTAPTRQAAIDNIAWHEYGHALSATLVSDTDKQDGPRLVELLPIGLRRAIDFPGGYRRRQVFDEVIASVYSLMISRVVHHKDYGVPEFIHPDVFRAFEAVVPWPPSPLMSDSHDIHAFPAAKLGAFLRAMEDPEGTGQIDADRERQIEKIEERIANASGRDAPPPSGTDER